MGNQLKFWKHYVYFLLLIVQNVLKCLLTFNVPSVLLDELLGH